MPPSQLLYISDAAKQTRPGAAKGLHTMRSGRTDLCTKDQATTAAAAGDVRVHLVEEGEVGPMRVTKGAVVAGPIHEVARLTTKMRSMMMFLHRW